MPLKENWFQIDEQAADSVTILLDFLRDLPAGLFQFIDPDTSDLDTYLSTKNLPGLTYKNTVTAYEEAKLILDTELKSLQAFPKNGQHFNKLSTALDFEGLSLGTLKLKLGLLNALWSNVYASLSREYDPKIKFGNSLIKKVLKKFLDYLNSLLDSIMEGVPGAGAIKELKEVIEGYLDLDED